jgi:hypothetical protein
VKGEILGDPPRAFELCRKNVMPLDWDENNEKLVFCIYERIPVDSMV